ncbi:MAG: hypothetical protein GXZ19_00200 [Bacteroidales bacterium]|nr:hypothetical protein [Bacteroidales bacterium]
MRNHSDATFRFDGSNHPGMEIVKLQQHYIIRLPKIDYVNNRYAIWKKSGIFGLINNSIEPLPCFHTG